MCDPPSIYPSLTEYISPFSTTTCICDPPRIYLSLPEYNPFSTTICDPLRIHPSLLEYTPLFNNYNIMRPSQNIPLSPRIYPLFNKCVCATLSESTPPSQNLSPFSTIICDPLRIHPTLPEYTTFSTTICDLPKIHPSLPEYTPFFNKYNIMRPSRIYPSFLEYNHPVQPIYMCDSESKPPSQKITPFSTTIILCDPPRIYPFSEYPFARNVYATL